MSPAPTPGEPGALLHALAGAMSDVAVVLDRDGRHLDILTRRDELLTRPATELLGRRIHDVLPQETADLLANWIQRALGTGRRVEGEYEIELGGRRVSFAAIIAPLSDTTVIWMARDITERMATEAQAHQSARMEAVGRLAGGVAHDFNNLLTAISTNAYLALDESHHAHDVREELGQIKRAADRAAGLARQLLAFSRKQMMQPRLLRIDDAVREAGTLLERLIGQDIQLVACLDGDTWPVLADPGQLTQVVVNLAVNARDAMPNGGVLTITAGNIDVTEQLAARHSGLRVGEYVVLTVRDTGTGMDRATRDRAFEPFFTTKEPGNFRGLGLATVYGIIQQSNGHIELSSEQGRGTAFWIFLPRANSDPTTSVVIDASEPEAAPANATVLVVEDEPLVRGAAARVLRRAGYTVLECANGLEALALWAERGRKIALIITDVVMPQLGGREMVRRLRQQGAIVPVLFISGYSEGATPELTDESGPSMFLTKPFDIAVFARLAGELIRRADSRSVGSAAAPVTTDR